MTHGHRRSARGGFSLIEVAVATAIVGIALAALLVAVGSHTRVTEAARKLTQATSLAEEIREWTLNLPFSDPDPGDAGKPPGPDGSDPQVFVDDLDDLMDVTFSPPRDGQGNVLPGLDGWSETLTLTWRDPNDPMSAVADGTTDLIYVQLDIAFSGRGVLTTGWLVARRELE